MTDEIHCASISDLYEEHADTLRRYIRRHLHSESDAEDVLQDVFVRLCRRGDLSDLHTPLAVLFKIAFRLSLNMIRQRRTSLVNPWIRIADLSVVDSQTCPERSLQAKDELEALSKIIATLSPQCQKVITLRHVHGLSYKEMADELGIAVSTIEKHATRGRKIYNEWRNGLRQLEYA